MRRLAIIAIAALMMSTVLSPIVSAEDVFITKYGKKYHKEGSRFIKNKEVEKITREEAEARGYIPSRDFLSDNESSDDKSEE